MTLHDYQVELRSGVYREIKAGARRVMMVIGRGIACLETR